MKANRFIEIMVLFISIAFTQFTLANMQQSDSSETATQHETTSVIQQNEDNEKKRASVPASPSLSLNGVRYDAINWGKARGLKQNGGYIAALDEKTGQQKWLVQVYEIHYKKDMEDDKQDVFIKKIAFGKNKKSLLIENDRGEHYILDLQTLTVKKQNTETLK
ncbi:hypothetical protein BAC3_00189 [uncultured bacterium]|nr:hypothetical protein BAC3_00189 [uncultured bacterium]